MTMTSADKTGSMITSIEEFEPEFAPDYVPVDLDALSTFIGSPQDYVNALHDLGALYATGVERVVNHRGHVYHEFTLADVAGNEDLLRVVDRSIFHTAFCVNDNSDWEHDEDTERFFRIPEGDWFYSVGFWGEKALFLKN